MQFQVNITTFKAGRQAGLSLVELMVSIAIGLLILAAVSTLFLNQSKARAELDKANRMIDNGRYAMDLLSDSLRLAGFYGDLDPGPASATLIATPPDPCSTAAADISAALPFHIQGYDAADTATDADISTTTCSTNSIPTTIKTGSDVLVIRRASTQAIAAASAISGTRYLQVSLCELEPATPFLVATAPATFNLSKKTCTFNHSGPDADLRSIRVQIYFIDADNKAGDGVPTLKMTELIDPETYPSGYTVGTFTPAIPLVEGIEYMQIDYGFDDDYDAVTNEDDNGDGKPDDRDGVPDTYASTPPDSDWSKAVTAKINIVSRNLETTTGHTDSSTYSLGTAGSVTPGGSYKRHAYTQVVRLVNPAARKE